ncbi:MAG: hypothetical protein [Caudoviricetes sp.]|nr:MAG: hypothetical protein [Caudoviricetes sp.]
MVQALLTSIKSMLGSQNTQNKEFKTEAIRNNKNVSTAVKDIYKIVSSSSRSNAKISSSLSTIESSTAATSDKVDRSNSLLQESISLQSQMLSEMRNLSKSMVQLLSGNRNNTGLLGGDQNQPGNGNLLAGVTALAAGAGLAAAPMAESYFFGNDGANAGAFAGSGVGSSENASKALEFFQSKGWTKEQAAGIVGNLQAESSRELNPSSVGDGGKAYGIAQWHPDRQANYERNLGNGKSIRQSTFDEQLAFIQWELENTESKAARLLKGAKTAAEAAQIFDQYYERSSGEHRGRRVANANKLIEGDDMGTYPSGTPQPQNTAMGGSGGRIMENQKGIRRLPINSKLKSVLQQAASSAGVDVEVFSGGQPRQGEGGQRTGSTRHDHGNAADVYLYKEGRKLRDPEDREIMSKFVSAAASAGATGIGFGGPGQYMGESGIHIGFGKSATWGGSPWIASAAAGVFSNQDLQMDNTDTSGAYASGGGGMGSDMFSSLGLLTGIGDPGAIAAMIGSYFGLAVPGLGAGSQQQSFASTSQSEGFDESSENEPNDMMGRSAGAGGPLVNSKEFGGYKKALAGEPLVNSKEFGDYKKALEPKNVVKEGDFDAATARIQTAAIENKKNYIMVNSDPKTKAYSTPPLTEAPTDFGAMGERSNRSTRASWAPRIAVLRPDDDATKSLTWAARIKGYA